MSKIMIENEKYELGTGMGCWAKSFEAVFVTKGDVRLIGGLLMSAYRIETMSFWNFIEGRYEVWWTPITDSFNTPENLKNWIKSQL